MENRNANIWKLSGRAKKSRRKFPAKIQLPTCRDDARCRNSLSICIVEYFSWCDCANRRHAIIAGFSFQEVWFSRRKFIFSGEKSVRLVATSHGGKPLVAIVKDMEQKFELTITNQRRVITSIILLPFVLLASIVIGVETSSFLGILSFAAFIPLAYYFVVGNLTLTIRNGVIRFHWKKKLIFNYSDIENLKESEIEKVIIDQGEFLRKIVAGNRVVEISTSKLNPKDSANLILYFFEITKTENIEIKNSWENIPLKRLKIFYALNFVAVGATLIILITVMIIKGYNPKMFLILGVVPGLILFGKQIRNAIDKHNSN